VADICAAPWQDFAPALTTRTGTAAASAGAAAKLMW